MTILLFDIDGTLIRSGGAGKAAMESALQSEFGVKQVLDRVSYSGRTDPAISRDLLEVHGVEPSAPNIERLKSAYLANLPAALRQAGGTVLPGVRVLLDRLSTQPTVALGLLTGNALQGARTKLEHFGLWHYFPFGSFADDCHERDDVARACMRAAHQHLGSPADPDRVWVIGDTPHDIQCARAIGARAVAVATGWHSQEELLAARADWVLADLSETERLLERWQ